jgi:hypothetical protein
VWLCGREDWSFAGVVYHTTNGGQSWTRQVVTNWFYYPYRITALPSGDAWFAGYAGAIFRRETSTAVFPTSYTLQTGVHIGGGLSELRLSDDAYFVAGPQYSIPRSQDPVMLELVGTVPSASPTSLQFELESRVTAEVAVLVEFWNYQTGSWETVHSSSGQQTDTTVTITASAPLTQYIEQSTRQVRARVRWRPAVTAQRGWQAYVDRTVWKVIP